jgi:hypothetical protein
MIRGGERSPSGRRDLVIATLVVIGLSRLADGPALWLIAALVFGAVALGARQLLRGIATTTIPLASVVDPALAAAVVVGAIRLVPIGLGLAVALAIVWVLVDLPLRIEERIVTASHGTTASDRTTLLVAAVVIGFVGFTGVAAMVPGGLADPTVPGATPLTDQGLLVLALADGLIAGLLGYRLAVTSQANPRAAAWSAATYAASVAIGAAALRAIGIPRLVGPGLLTLVLFLWDAFLGTSPARRRDPRWIWQTALLVLLGVAVIAWNLRLPG